MVRTLILISKVATLTLNLLQLIKDDEKKNENLKIKRLFVHVNADHVILIQCYFHSCAVHVLISI